MGIDPRDLGLHHQQRIGGGCIRELKKTERNTQGKRGKPLSQLDILRMVRQWGKKKDQRMWGTTLQSKSLRNTTRISLQKAGNITYTLFHSALGAVKTELTRRDMGLLIQGNENDQMRGKGLKLIHKSNRNSRIPFPARSV